MNSFSQDENHPLPPSGSTPSGRRPLSLQVMRNVTFSIVRKLVSGPIYILLVPFILHRVGSVGYGTWSVLGTIMGLGWLLDLGVGASITKFVAEYNGKNDTLQLRRLLDTALGIYFLITAVVVLVLALLYRPLVAELFRGPHAPSPQEVFPLWLLLIAIVAFDLLAKPFITAVNGCQRMDLLNVILFCSTSVNAALTVLFLCLGAKVDGLLWAALCSTLVNLCLSAGMAHRLLPSVIPNPLRFRLSTARRICTFGLGMYSVTVMNTIQGQVEKLYLARLIGVVPVGWYGMASDGAGKVRRIPDLLLAPVMAAASELDAADARHKVSQLYFRSHKYVALVTLPLVIFALVDAKLLMTAWLGPKFAFIALPFAILTVGSLASEMESPVWSVLAGRGILRPGIYTALITSVLNVGLSLVFIRRWGFLGAAWGSVLPIVVANAYYFFVTRRYFDLPLTSLLRRAYLKPTLCSLAAGAAMSGINMVVSNLWLALIAGTVVYATVYPMGLLVTRFFDEFDWSKLEAHVPLARHARRLIPISYGLEN